MTVLLFGLWAMLMLLVVGGFAAVLWEWSPHPPYRGQHRAPVDWRQLAVTSLAVAVSCWAGFVRWLADSWTAYAKSHVWRTMP